MLQAVPAAHNAALRQIQGVGSLAVAEQQVVTAAPTPRLCSRAASLSTPTAAAAIAAVGLAACAGTRAAQRRQQRRAQRQTIRRAHADGADGRFYANITGFPFPLGPLFARKTVRTQVGDGMWTFEQEQSLANIAVNVRMTVIRLEDGSLWVHNPIAPTEECVALMEELGMPVKYIVLGSTQYEHKIFVGPFSRRWPDAKIWVVNQQWSWPLDLPVALLGVFTAGELKDGATDLPWADEIEQKVFSPTQRLGTGVGLNYSAAECAFFHKRSKTLLCTDALIYVPEDPPAVLDEKELRYLGTDNNIVLQAVGLVNWRGSGELVREAGEAEVAAEAGGSESSRWPRKSEADLLKVGWQRDALLSIFFGPDGRSILEPQEAFGAVSGRWIVGPVCYALVYGGDLRREVLDWTNSICEWDFEQILPAHFAGPVAGKPDDVRRAFEVLEDNVEADQPAENPLPWPFPELGLSPEPVRYRAKDLQLLTDIRNVLRQVGVI